MRNGLILLLAVLAGPAGCGRTPAPGDAPGTPTAAASGPDAPAQLGLCASCHGRDGIAVIPGTPNLAGRDRADLLAAMQAYLDGSRDYPPMRAMLGPVRPADRERLADWYAAQPAPVATGGSNDGAPSAPTTAAPPRAEVAPAPASGSGPPAVPE
jgi:cytochrome c553